MNNDLQSNSKPPHVSVKAQYIKDFSFESPNSPGVWSLDRTKQPAIDLSLDLSVNNMPEEGYFEVELFLNIKAQIEDKALFLVDLKYAGLFQLIDVPEEQKQVILAVYCPGIIFPYARRIISDVTQDGGFYPLSIDPVDFSTLYAKKMAADSNREKN